MKKALPLSDVGPKTHQNRNNSKKLYIEISLGVMKKSKRVNIKSTRKDNQSGHL